jgi:flagellar biosynthesis protein FlhB
VADDSKTEQATPRRRQKAREKGQVPRSRELGASLAAAATLAVLVWKVPDFCLQWKALLRDSLTWAGKAESFSDVVRPSWENLTTFQAAGLAAGASWLIAVLASVAQGGLVLAPSSLGWRTERISPAAKMKQLFSLTALSNLLKSLLPVAAIIFLAAGVLIRDWQAVLLLPYRGGWHVAVFTFQRLGEIGWKAALVLLVWAGADYLFQRVNFERDLRMSRQEVVDEYKETEGHPTIKGRIRRLQRQVRRRRMLKDTEKATVVVTNPNEFAVALEYRPEMGAPIVVAKGRNLLAQQIKQVARWYQIPIVENPPLAHALYRAVEVGHSIPSKLYAVVAEVLAVIYRAQARAQQVRAAS